MPSRRLEELSTEKVVASRSRDEGLSDPVTAAALDELYRQFFGNLVRHAIWHYGLGKDDAVEVVQEAFLLAITKLSTTGNPKAWMYRVVGNLAANWKRKESRRARLLAEWGPISTRSDGASRDDD